MRIKLTPKISYIVGVTKYCGVGNGIGIKGRGPLQRAFAQGAIEAGIASPDKMVVKTASIRFYHSTYKAFISKMQKEAVDKYKHHNDYAAAYLAGIFDSVGMMEEGRACLRKCDRMDDAIFENLGFGIRNEGGKLRVGHWEQFLKFVSGFRKVDDLELMRR